ncbi:MAG: hypothetical protein WC877_03310 [Dehalococcoidales bacterium]|jgi:hypothetical protein|nr:hypothetical protein [Candidatus Neomarinimicrobiota bacterium]
MTDTCRKDNKKLLPQIQRFYDEWGEPPEIVKAAMLITFQGILLMDFIRFAKGEYES